jgi:hypothetical protein
VLAGGSGVVVAGVVPRGLQAGAPVRGKVVFFYSSSQTSGGTLPWYLLDPETQALQSFTAPAGSTPLACGAATWTEHGRWFVAGGAFNQQQPNGCVGGDRIFTYDPEQGAAGTWIEEKDALSVPIRLKKARYYPSVVKDPTTDDILVMGGSCSSAPSAWPVPGNPGETSYEAFAPGVPTRPMVPPSASRTPTTIPPRSSRAR